MKKIIILLSVFMFLSCSKDDDNNEKQLQVSNQNLAGKWYYQTITKQDGSQVTFHGNSCTTQKDWLECYSIGKIITYNYYSDCVSSEDNGCTQYTLDSQNRFMNGGILFDNAKVVELTSSKLKIEFSAPKNLGFMCTITDATSMVFVR